MRLLPRYEHPGGRQDGAGHHRQPQPARPLRFRQLHRPGGCFAGRTAPHLGQGGQLVRRQDRRRPLQGPELPAGRHPVLHQPGGFLRGLCRRLRHAEADAAGRLPGPA